MNRQESSPEANRPEFEIQDLFQGSREISSLEFLQVVLTKVIPPQHRPQDSEKTREHAFEIVQKYGFDDELNDAIGRQEVADFRRQFLDALDAYDERDYERLEAAPEVVDRVSAFIEQFDQENRLNRMTTEVYQVAVRGMFVVLEPQRFSEFK